ncbi:MAG: Zn-dependent hydrolase [Acidimicrobiales bacterium]
MASPAPGAARSSYDPARVVADLRALAERTGGPGGARRLAWTPGWLEARAMLREELAGLPVRVEQDEAGNLWAYLAGERDELVVVGSHLDAVPSGGWLDGALGVMAGLELLRSLAADAAVGRPPRCGVALVDWADEEGARFSRSLFGSAAVAGTLEPDLVRDLTDAEGRRLEDVVAEHGVRLDAIDAARSRLDPVRAYVEVHIEQGPVLEHRGRAISAVTGTFGIERERLVFRGQAAHAGTMPMAMRRDSLRAASRFALELADIAAAEGGVGTVGQVVCRPGVVTAVPGETRATMDLRHGDAAGLEAMYRAARDAAERAAATEGCTVSAEPLFRVPPRPFAPQLLDAARAAVRELEGHDDAIPSGALHDATEIAALVPTVMVFSSSTGGLSHTREEDTPTEHLELAVAAFDATVRAAIDLVADGRLEPLPA